MRPLPFLLLALLAVTAAPAYAGMVNGSLEPLAPFSGVRPLGAGSSELAGWTVTGSGVRWIGGSAQLPAADGSAFVDLASGGIEQTIATNPNEAYDVRFVLLGSSSGVATVSAAGLSQAFPGSNAQGFLTWEERAFRFVARSRLTTIAFTGGSGPSGPVLVDRVTTLSGAPTTTRSTTWGALKQLYR